MKLDLNKIFKLPEFTFDGGRKCYRPKKLNAKIKFQYNVATQQDRVLFMLSFTYNSIQRPNLVLKINGKIMNSRLLTSYTGSYDKLMSLRMEDGPYYFNKGINEIEVISGRIFPDIYEMELYPYTQNLNQQINAYSYKMSDFVIIECYNLYGGFYWHINNFIMCCYFCNKFNKIPIVNFSNGLFCHNTSVENNMIKQNTNWFYNYFKNYLDIPPSIYQAVLQCPNKVRINNISLSNYKKYHKFGNDNEVLLFKREGFLSIRERCYVEEAHSKLVPKYLQVLPHITQVMNKIKSEIFPVKNDLQRFIGIHFRGTDKIEEVSNKEQCPKHFKYEDVYQMLIEKARKLIQENSRYDIYIIACSDEQPFIDFLKKRLRKKLICYNGANRSPLNTSGLKEDFTKIPNREKGINLNTLNPEQKKLYEKRSELIDKSIHMGTKNLSNYKKGLDCLIDAFLMEDVDFLYQSKGNFSLYCEYFNKNSNLKVLSIEDELTKSS